MAADGLEDVVVEAVMIRLDVPLPPPEDDERDTIADDEARLLAYADDYDAGVITRPEWLRLRARVEARLNDARRRRTEAIGRTVLDPYVGGRCDPGGRTYP